MIYVKPVLPHGGGYNGYLSLCGYSLCFRVGVIGGKVTIYLRNDKGNGKKFLREVGEYEMLNGWYMKKSQ